MNVNLCLISWFNHGQLFNKFKPLNIWIKIIFIELLLERKLSFIRVLTLMWFGGLFCARPAIFPPFRQVWSLGFLWSTLWHFWSVFLWFLKMEFNPLPDLLNTGFTIIEMGLFYGGENLEAKIRRLQTFLDKMAMFFEAYDVWKHFKYWSNSSNLHQHLT